MIGRMKRLIILLVMMACACASPSIRESHRLIEWGWDTPKLQQISAILAQAQTLPFDGLVTDVEMPQGSRDMSWTLISQTRVDQQLLDDLAAQYSNLAWGRLTDNFLRLTMFPNPDLKWFEELDGGWSPVEDNVRQWARLAKLLGFKGIMLDVEQYGEAHLFDYSRQPDAAQIDYETYAAQVYEEGRRFMSAMQAGYPGLTVMSTYFLTGSPSADPTRYTLLRPFMEGMIETTPSFSELVDGYESSYIYKDEGQFNWARDQILTQKPEYLKIEKFDHSVRVGFGLWIDPVCGDGGLPPEGCGFTPTEFKAAVTSAMSASDRYVWIYSEKINWYTGKGIPAVWVDAAGGLRR
jgi:hypothetical protein